MIKAFFISSFTKIKLLLNVLFARYTWTGILVIALVTNILFLVISSINKYNSYDWWNWKKKALLSCLIFDLILVAIKLIIRGF